MVKLKNTADLMTPLLDIYKNEPVALVGCHSRQIEREKCEYDIIVIGEKNLPKTIRVGGKYFEIVYMDEKELLNSNDPEVSLSLSSMMILRDTTFSLSTAYSYHRTMVEQNKKKAAERRLALSLKCIARSEEAVEHGKNVDAGFWMAYSGYNLAFAWILLKGGIPSPSHLIEQTKRVAKTSASRFEVLARSLALSKANKQTCLDRLQALNILMDTLENSQSSIESNIEDFSLIREKSSYLIENMMPVECFSFLGLKISEYVLSLSSALKHDDENLPVKLLSEDTKLLGKRVVESFSFSQPEDELKRCTEDMKVQILKLARMV